MYFFRLSENWVRCSNLRMKHFVCARAIQSCEKSLWRLPRRGSAWQQRSMSVLGVVLLLRQTSLRQPYCMLENRQIRLGIVRVKLTNLIFSGAQRPCLPLQLKCLRPSHTNAVGIILKYCGYRGTWEGPLFLRQKGP